MHHILLAMPILALVLFIFLPWPIALALYIPIAAVSVFGYWKAFQALRRSPVSGQGAMIGGQAEVVSSNDSQIEVRYHGEIWHAVSAQPLQSGQQVIIEDIEGLTLQVAPLPQPALGESSK